MLKKLFAFLIFTLCIFQLKSQNIVYGYVQDSSSQEKLIGTNIKVLNRSGSTLSNNYGYFSLKYQEDTIILSISHLGYKQTYLSVNKNTPMPIIIPIAQESVLFGNVTVKTKKESKIVEEVQMSTINITMNQIKMLPRFMGETDILKAIQLMPGIKGGSEGSTGLYVRGGGADQNLILLDGAMVYNPSHLFGFFSVFNTDAINNVQMLKGGFPARYGGRLSSVLDISMKDGNMKKFKGEGSIGALASKFTFEGPIIKDKVSFMVSARRTYLDLMLQPILRLSSGNPNLRQGYFFSDFNGKVNWRLNAKNRLYFSYYNGVDRFYQENKPYTYLYDGNVIKEQSLARNQWGNQLATLRFNQIINKNLFVNTQLNLTKYFYEIDESFSNSEQTDTGLTEQYNFNGFGSKINDITLKSDAEYNQGRHYIRFGLSAIYHRFVPGQSSIVFRKTGEKSIDTTFGSGVTKSVEMSAYLEDDFDFSKQLKLNYGLHFNLYNYKKSFFPSIQPRVALRYLLNKTLSLKGSYANMVQNIHLLTNNTIGLPNDLWVPATNLVKPMKSNQVAVGLAKMVGKFELTFETYYKNMRNVIEFKEGASFLNVNNSWENKVARGNGKAYGFEFLAQKKSGNLTGWIGYTLSWVKRTIPELNFGKEFYYKYDSRHDVSFVLNYKENEKWDYGLVWVFRTGNALTMPTGAYPGHLPGGSWSGTVFTYSGRNNFRFADYHRLDLSVTRHYKKKWGMLDLNFSIYNTYSRINPFYYRIGTDFKGNKQITRVGLFPILPSLNLGFKF
ncbi:MAG: TonB-dependent receptor plug domain-containing protein [Bacteroidota bacterium]|nr:TonB-dependent receptor plug domain-containing protein [Bacteroidota bacterium]